jgi:hypothetical protein
MRLTLRTLLAWLDDTLPANEVRQIGKQVAESPYAQELVDRTYRVTRQRRLLVPSSTGPESTDPNIVAAYLDNELPPEEVAEYEKKCLTSDVNLAEVASVHQILSLIGQKAKVPPDAKNRMYRLVKGRESAYAQEAVRRPSPPPAPEPVTPPPTPWSTPPSPARPLAERLGIASLVVGLIGLIGWTAYMTFAPEGVRPVPRIAQAEAPLPPAPPGDAKDATKDAGPEMANQGTPPESKSALAEGPPPAESAAAKPDEGKAAAPTAAKLTSPSTLLLAWNPDKGDWTRVASGSTIKPSTRILNLAPFWSTIQADSARVTLIDETEVTYVGSEKRAAMKIQFDRGKLVLSGGSDGAPFEVTHGGKSCSIVNSPGTLLGLQRSLASVPGVAKPEARPIAIYVGEGEVVMQIGDSRRTLKGPAIATWTEAGEIQTSSKSAIPPWVTDAGPPPSAKELGERFLKDFSPNGSVLRDLVQAVDGDDPDARRLAIMALGATGEAEMVVPVLNNAMTDAATRRAAAEVLRTMLARGGETAKAVRDELAKVFGAELAGSAEKLLQGFTAEEGTREATYTELVRLLSAPELGTRELALQSLMTLTGRDNLEYDPTKPEGKGLRAWQDLLVRKEILKNSAPAAPR